MKLDSPIPTSFLLFALLPWAPCFVPAQSVDAQVVVDGKSANAWPREALRAVTSGVSRVLVRGDCRRLGPFSPLEPVRLSGEEGIIAGAKLFNTSTSKTDGAILEDLWVDGQIDCRASEVKILRCEWRDFKSQCIRLRFGACRCVIQQCRMIRMPPFTTSDVVAIQLVDGKNLDNQILDNIILNYSDAVQTTDRKNLDGSSDDYGFAAGLVIRGNHLGFTKHVREGNNNIAGCENALDFKTGGTPENPVLIERNYLSGVLPSVGNPKGYAVTYHRCASDLIFRKNEFVECESAIFNNTQWRNCVPKNGKFDPRVILEGNTLTGTPKLLVGPGKVTLR